MHNLTKTLAAMSLLAPLTAHSLGVGDIKLHSALNQKLNAEIALSLTTDEDLADIKVTLAAPDKFDKLGISWSYFLSKIKFQPVVKSNGKIVIKVTSDEVVQEPFLDFLVEVSWPKGDIFKEFTVLVDPPVVYQKNSIDAPLISSTQTTYNGTNADTAAQNNYSGLAVDGEYGPTNRNDSLWKVAEKVNQHSDVSVEQMMMALYEANPRAFYKKNVNALMAGVTLKVPERSDIVRLSKKQANTQFYRQMAVWEGKAVAEPGVQQVKANANNSQLTLVPPTEEEVTHADTLTANSTDQEGLATENQQLQERLANLEKQFAIMQEMMAIKDQQLAVMQNVHTKSDVQADSTLNQNQQAVIDNAEQVDSQEVADTELDTIPSSKPVQAVETEEVVVSEKQPVVTPPPAPVYKVPKKPAVQHESGVNYSYIGMGLFGVLAIGGIGWLFWRRRQAEEEINENSMFASSSEIFLPDTDNDDLDVPIFDEKSSYDVGTVGESSFLSEFTPSDFDVFETDQAEVDPTSEADVYLAYGRYQQAEELMRQATIDYPDKDDYKLKLLEIFYTSENGEGYEGFANELVAEGKNTDLNFWAKVTEMGKELIPGSALFSPEQAESKFTTDAESPEGSSGDNDEVTQVADVSLELDEDSSDIDFDLSSFSLDDDSSNELADFDDTSATEASDDLESVDFDLSAFESMDSAEDSGALDVSSDEAIESIEFNADETGDISLDDFDFSATESTLTEPHEESATLDVADTQAAEESDNNDFDFDFDFDEISDAPVADISGDSENNLVVSDLTDMDEFETKIDLAKAYIDMGDESAAKDIAEEVLDKGNEAQKNEAQAIIDKLS